MSSQSSISKTQKLRNAANKLLQKMKLSKNKDDLDLGELSAAKVQVARSVTFTRPTEAPRIVDLKALKRDARPQTPRIRTHQSGMQHSLEKTRNHASYERLDDEESDVDWSLLDLPENILERLANDSRHSLI